MTTNQRCSYCDDWPIGRKEDSIDHFRPKSNPRFHHLVCKWENLYYTCGNCQAYKAEKWSDDPMLIAPDEDGYTFENFFFIDSKTWRIEPNPNASAEDQSRAEYTITTLGLRDEKHINGRRLSMERFIGGINQRHMVDLQDFAYRYMFA